MKYLVRFLSVVVVLGIIGAVGYYFLTKPIPVPLEGETPSSTPVYTLTNGSLVYTRGNFKINVPPLWSPADPQSVRAVEGVSDVRFALRRAGGECTILYVRALRQSFAIPPLRQLAFADRVFTRAGEQLDSSWWVHESRVVGNPEFNDLLGQPNEGEMRIVSHPDDRDASQDFVRSFILYNEFGGPVSRICDAEFSEMLRSFEWVFEKMSLAAPSIEGALYVRALPRETPRVLFVGSDGVAREVMRLSAHAYAGNLSAYHDRLYTQGANQIMQINPFANRESPAVVAPEGVLIDFLIVDDRIFYLTAPDLTCLDMGRCVSTLYDIVLGEGTSNMRAQGVQAGRIMGYDTAEDALYLQTGYGDAGCFGLTISRYSYKANTLEEVARVGGCEGEPGFDAAEAQLKAFQARFKAQSEMATHVRISEGRLLHPEESAISDGAAVPLRFMGR